LAFGCGSVRYLQDKNMQRACVALYRGLEEFFEFLYMPLKGLEKNLRLSTSASTGTWKNYNNFRNNDLKKF